MDELAVVAAYFLALIFEYKENFFGWYRIFEGLYVSLLLVICISQALILLIYDSKRPHVFAKDPFENFMSVIKSRLLLLVFTLAYLFSTKNGDKSSRLVVGVFFIASIFLGYAVRMTYRKIYLSRHSDVDRWKTLEISAPYPSGSEVVKRFRDGGYKFLLVHGEPGHNVDVDNAVSGYRKLNEIIKECEAEGIRVYVGLDSYSYRVRSGIIMDINGYASIPAFVRKERFDLFGVHYAVARTEEAVLHVIRHIRELSGQYICFSNVHTSVMAREDAGYRDVLNGAAFVFPDGKPIAILQEKKGIGGAERVAGPDFMEHMFKDTQDGKISHFFYGSTQETLDSLKKNLEKNYPGINIKGMYSPPFRPLTEEEDKADIDMINSSGADIVWIGLGAPRQEKWMQAHKNKINGVMMGVGAGFDFHGGTIKRAPLWIQKIGFEWLFRLFQDPGRLFKRYFVTNAKFFWYLLVSR